MDKKICPIIYSAMLSSGQLDIRTKGIGPIKEGATCLGDECACFNEETGTCQTKVGASV